MKITTKSIFNLRNLFLTLSVGLSILSLQAGFHLYMTFFGLGMAIVFASVLELLRLSSLFTFGRFGISYKIIAGITYTMVASFCFTVAVISFNSQVMEKEEIRLKSLERDMSGDIFEIRKAYSIKVDEEIEKIKLELKDAERYASLRSESPIWTRRINILKDKILEINTKRDEYLKIEPTIEWINSQKAILGIKTIEGVYDKENLTSIELAVMKFLGVSHVTFQKMLGFAIAVMIELGIILLALFGMSIGGSKYIKNVEEIDVVDEEDYPKIVKRKKILRKVI